MSLSTVFQSFQDHGEMRKMTQYHRQYVLRKLYDPGETQTIKLWIIRVDPS